MPRRGTSIVALCVVLLLRVPKVYGYYDYDYNWSPESEEWSTPEECARQCVDGERPRTCYYHFVLELYTTMGAACDFCKPNITNQLSTVSQCQCILGDGFEKTVFSINRMIPAPSIQVCRNDYIVVDVENKAEGLEASIHWHGIFQKGYQYYDGVPYLTQCPIHSENTFRYQFRVQNSGTHFFHSHISTHMMDGQYGSLIVRDQGMFNPHKRMYNADLPEHVIVISDWMHELSLERFPGRYRSSRGQQPENFLINGKGTWTDPATNRTTDVPLANFIVKPGLRYRFRIIDSFSSVCLAALSIEGHSLTIIAVDGENVEPVTVNEINMSTGERVDFVLNANQPRKSYWFHLRGLGECMERRIYQNAVLMYDGSNPRDISPRPSYEGFSFPSPLTLNPLNATQCSGQTSVPGGVCYNQLKSVDREEWGITRVVPDYRMIIPFNFASFNGSLRASLFYPGSSRMFYVGPNADHVESQVGNITFKNPPAPPISQLEGYEYMCPTNMELSQCTQPCTCTHVYHIPLGALVEVVVYDSDPFPVLSHPFHLHGYAFTVFDIGQFGMNITKKDVGLAVDRHIDRLKRGGYSRPCKKDTLVIPMGGYAIIRFWANNPGWWLYHCHFTWHTVSGMDVVFHVGHPRDLPPVPKDFPMCKSWTPPPNE